VSDLIEEYVDADGKRGFHMWCPGCEVNHGVIVSGGRPGPQWEWNGSKTAPTFSPSILVRWTFGPERTPKTCHSFIRGGQWQFLSDCTHKLAGQTVPMIAVEGK